MADKRRASGSAARELSPDRFEAVLSSISDGVFTIDVKKRVTSFNQAAELITGPCFPQRNMKRPKGYGPFWNSTPKTAPQPQMPSA